LSCLFVQRKVLEILKNDPALKEYVAQFSIGEEKAARKIFPYVTVSKVTEDIEALCIGRDAPDLHHYSITIQAGTYHTLPKISCEGNGTNTKGIIQLADDIVAAIYPGNLDGILKTLLRLIEVCHEETEGTGGRSRVATIKLKGSRKA